MMKYEFEQIAGYEVTWKDYTEIIEPMYMALDVDKYEFAKMINRKHFDLGAKKRALVKEMKQIAEHLKDTCNHYTDYAAKDRLNELADEYMNLVDGYGYYIAERERWTCYYPTKIDIYDKHYGTIIKIELIAG